MALEFRLQLFNNGAESAINGMGRRCEKFSEYKRHELTLTVGERIKARTLQILRNEVVQFLFLFGWEKLLQNGDALGVAHIFQNLTAQRPLA